MIFFNLQKQEIFWHSGIPRTATRYVTSLLESSGYTPMGNSKLLYNGHETLHLRLDLAKEMFSKMRVAEPHLWNFVTDFPSKQFAVVRNPVERFKSASFQLWNMHEIETYDDFVFFMEKRFSKTEPKPGYRENPENIFYGYKNSPNGWFEHQSAFVEPHTHIWKLENGLGRNFVDWLNDVVGISTSYGPVSYEKQEYDNNANNKSSVHPMLLKFAKQYYRQDFLQFGYDYD